MKLLITGGHVTPALAVIDELLADKKRDVKKSDLVFVGRRYVDRRKIQTSFEFQEVSRRDIRFVNITAGRFTRTVSLQSLVNLILFPYGILQALQIVRQENPEAILSFGGYIGLPICIAGFLFRKKIYIHEQTIHPGITNRVSAAFAKKIFVSFKESLRFFPRKKTLFTGNPLRKSIFETSQKTFTISGNKPVIYITGGSLGAHSINNHISRILDELLQHFIVIHQTGNVKEYNDFQKLQKQRQRLRNDLKKNYILKEHVTDDEIGYVYSVSDMVVARAGANTFFELITLQKPAVFIPLPWSAHHEQQKHAELFHKAGAGEIFPQSQRSQLLLELIQTVANNASMYKKNIETLRDYVSNHATTNIIATIFNST